MPGGVYKDGYSTYSPNQNWPLATDRYMAQTWTPSEWYATYAIGVCLTTPVPYGPWPTYTNLYIYRTDQYGLPDLSQLMGWTSMLTDYVVDYYNYFYVGGANLEPGKTYAIVMDVSNDTFSLVQWRALSGAYYNGMFLLYFDPLGYWQIADDYPTVGGFEIWGVDITNDTFSTTLDTAPCTELQLDPLATTHLQIAPLATTYLKLDTLLLGD